MLKDVYLKPNVVLEPLFDKWYVWSHLISPATAALNISGRHIEIMDSFSAHADRHEIMEFIDNQKKGLKKLFLVHGEKKTQEKFRTLLNENGYKKVYIPKLGQEMELK